LRAEDGRELQLFWNRKLLELGGSHPHRQPCLSGSRRAVRQRQQPCRAACADGTAQDLLMRALTAAVAADTSLTALTINGSAAATRRTVDRQHARQATGLVRHRFASGRRSRSIWALAMSVPT
jgi:hypothetical protein